MASTPDLRTTSTICCSGNKKINQQAIYEGQDISDTAKIVINKDSKKVSLQIRTDGKWVLFSGTSVGIIDFSKPLLKGEGSGTFEVSTPGPGRNYYQLETGHGKAILAEQQLPMAGGYNFRDLGGIKTKEGRYIKWGKLFRSDDLHLLTEADLQYLSSIPIRTIVDFRGQDEMQQAPDKIPASVHEEYKLSIDPGNVTSLMGLTKLEANQMDDIMKKIYTLSLSDSVFIDKYKEFFKLLQDQEELPLLFHCSAGKDRTGTGAALVLYALGVDEKKIMDDYMASNTYLSDKYAKELEMYPNLIAVLTVKLEFLQTGIERIKTDFGSIKNYLEQALGVDIQKFREQYLY